MPKIKFPTQISKFINVDSEITISGNSINSLLNNLFQNFPQLQKSLMSENNNDLQAHIRLALNDEIINSMEYTLKDDDIITILIATAGG